MKLKKCSFCGNWTSVTGDEMDECEVCQSPVHIETLRRKVKRQITDDFEPALFYKVQSSDAWYTVIIRRIAGSIYFVIMAIISFIVWLVALLPG